MKKTLAILAMTAATLTLVACSNSGTSLPPGHYENSKSTTSTGGTSTDRNTSTDVYYDANGDKRATTTTKTTQDPPGLFNKSTSTSTSTH